MQFISIVTSNITGLSMYISTYVKGDLLKKILMYETSWYKNTHVSNEKGKYKILVFNHLYQTHFN